MLTALAIITFIFGYLLQILVKIRVLPKYAELVAQNFSSFCGIAQFLLAVKYYRHVFRRRRRRCISQQSGINAPHCQQRALYVPSIMLLVFYPRICLNHAFFSDAIGANLDIIPYVRNVPTHTEDGIPIRKLYVSNLPLKVRNLGSTHSFLGLPTQTVDIILWSQSQYEGRLL